MEKPLISILIPVYNCEPFLRECLDSVVGQTYDRLEVICVNDGSTDGSLPILLEYAGRYDFIEVIDRENSGVASARNRLLEAATGDYILFVDADDSIKPEMAEWMLAQAEKENADVVTCKICINGKWTNTGINREILDKSTFIYKFIYHRELNGSLCNKLIRRELTKGVKFHPEISYGEDALFCWHVFQNCEKMIMTNKELYNYRMNPESISHQKFGAKKLTGHKTWSIITKETEKWWPQYLDTALSRWGMEDFHLLMQAGAGGYHKDQQIADLQSTVTKHLKLMISSGMLSGKHKVNAIIVGRWFHYAAIYAAIHNIKKTF